MVGGLQAGNGTSLRSTRRKRPRIREGFCSQDLEEGQEPLVVAMPGAPHRVLVTSSKNAPSSTARSP